MASQVQICNLALASIGKDVIASMGEASEAARQCTLHFDAAREELLLGNHDWSFARSYQVLAQNGTNTQSKRFDYCYTLPDKVLKIIKPLDRDQMDDNDIGLLPYEIASGLIYSDMPLAVMRFVRNEEDISKFTPAFVLALWNAIAAKICFPLTKDLAFSREVGQKAAQAIMRAEASDANSDQNTTYFYPDHLAARNR